MFSSSNKYSSTNSKRDSIGFGIGTPGNTSRFIPDTQFSALSSSSSQFSASSQYGTPLLRQRRPSTNDSQDDFVKPRRFSVGGTVNPSRTQLDRPCRPATIAMLYRYRDPETGMVKLHGSHDACPVSLVGWLYSGDAEVRTEEAEFRFSDGSGSALVKVDIKSEQEPWLLPHIRQLVLPDRNHSAEAKTSTQASIHSNSNKRHDDDGVTDCAPHEDAKEVLKSDQNRDEESTVEYRYLRLVADITQDIQHGRIVLSAIHLREAQPAEAAYHHTIESILLKLQLSASASSASSASASSALLTSDLLVSLDACFDSVTDEDQLLILKYITKYRNSSYGGVSVDALQYGLREAISKERREVALKRLEEDLNIIYSDTRLEVDIPIE